VAAAGEECSWDSIAGAPKVTTPAAQQGATIGTNGSSDQWQMVPQKGKRAGSRQPSAVRQAEAVATEVASTIDPSILALLIHKDTLFNPQQFNTNLPRARFFVIKSFSEDDVHTSIK